MGSAVKHSKLPLTLLCIYIAFSIAVEAGLVPSGLKLLEALQAQVGEAWFWFAVFCIFLEALVVICFYFPGQYIAALLVILSAPNWQSIVSLSLAMVIATTAGSAINYSIGRSLSKQPQTRPLSFKTLLPAMIHSSGLAVFTFYWGMQRGSAAIIPVSFLINLPYYLLIVATTVIFGEQIVAATDNPFIIGSGLTIWLVISLWRDSILPTIGRKISC